MKISGTKAQHTQEEADDDFGDFNKMLGQELDGSPSDSENEEENEECSASEESRPDCSSEGADIEEELLKLDEMNKQQEEKQSVPVQVEDMTSTYRLLATMHKEGAAGVLDPSEYEFLKIFSDPNAEQILQDQASDLIRQVEALFKTPVYKKLNKQKLLRQRINHSISEKTKQYLNKYDDMPFIVSITKDFCYKTGTKLFRKKTGGKHIPKINRKTYDKMVGFCVPVGEYKWSEEKNEEFINCVLRR
ncbi:uncharacterized protein NESG_00922 [Nematocida ausubeli]|uniref:Uncharacterized protein n=1 Tax=Nematocida ausubeli (strain ATCC PRA-371 / ERTm2) TaxID=1913371 RepID=A0A086J3P8_NEMA1|nr:uncharacterized protein NESG_00922 [Nematocida ausubeli]KFG26766.1 hypothetical protein NESG_00922 [Nematocida ausubeli]